MSLALQINLPRNIEPTDERIFSVLNDFIQLESTLKIANVIERLDGISTNDRSDFLATFFEIVLYTARQLPHDHVSQERLVNLVNSLRTQGAGWEGILTQGSGEIAEAWRGPKFPSDSTFVEGKHKAPTAVDIAQWLNVNSFLARLWKSVGSTPNSEINFELYASIALRSALEGYSAWTGSPRAEEDRKSDGALDSDIAIAAEWIKQAGSLLYIAGHGKDGGDKGPERLVAEGGLYLGPQGLCDEHWGFWKSRFGEINDEAGVSVISKELASKSKLTMESIEQ